MKFGRGPLTEEFRLLVECCRHGFGGDNAHLIADLAKTVDWQKVATLSRRHRVQGLVWHALRDLDLPEVARADLSQGAAEVAEQNLRAAQLSKTLLEAFDEAGIPLLFVKGLTLSMLAYGDPLLKMGWDVDILVPPHSIEAAAAELEKLGFQLIIPSPGAGTVAKWHKRRKESVWRSPEGVHVELHTRLADSRDLIPSIDNGSKRQEVPIAPAIVLPTLGLADLVAYLCVHGASSAWFRLKWSADLAALLHPLPPSGVAELYDHARRAGAGRAADQALLLAGRLFGIPIGLDLERRLGQDRISRWLAETALNQMLRAEEPTKVFLGTIPIHLTQVFLQSGPPFKMREATRQIGDWAGSLLKP